MRSKKGFTLIELMIVIAIIAIIAAIAIPNLIQARKSGNEAAAIGAMKTIATSQAIFREGDKERDGNYDYGMLSELSNYNIVDSVLGAGTKQGYEFFSNYGFSTSEFLWWAFCNPKVPQTTGDRYFAGNQAGLIFYTTSLKTVVDTNSCTLPVTNGPLLLPIGK